MTTTARNYRTPIGILTSRGSLTLTVAAGRARGTHTDVAIDGRDLADALASQRAICEEWAARLGLAQITVYAPEKHGGHTVDVVEAV